VFVISCTEAVIRIAYKSAPTFRPLLCRNVFLYW